MLFAVIGIGSVAVLLLIGLLFFAMRGEGGTPAVAQSQPIEPIQPVAATPPSPTPTVSPASTETASSTPAAPITAAMDHEEIIRRVKDATVFIIMKVGDRPVGSGSGFVIEVRGDTCLIATNRHVAVPDLSELPPGIAKKGAKPSVEVVFRSGLGAQEQKLPVGLLAADLSGDYGTDLAFLVATGVKNPPKEVNISSKVEATEGMTYIGAGFPLGKSLNGISESKGNPSVTITTGIVGRIHRDEHGLVTMLQVGGSLLPGNSGGPLIEQSSGKLLGVAVASLAVSGLDSVGFIVTADELRRALNGRVGALDLTVKAISPTSADLQITAQTVDPKQKIQGVMLNVAPASAGNVSPNSDGSWPVLPKSTSVELTNNPKTASASGQVQVTLSGEGAAARKVLIQAAYKDRKGTLVYSKPKEYELPEKPGRIRPPGALERMVKAARAPSFALVTTFVDPSKDCKLIKEEEGMKFKIEIPGNKIHTLAPYAVSRNDKKKPLHNAPMALAEIEGDFVAMVEVTGEMSPGSTIPKDRQGNMIPFTFNGAGLILYKDKDNFVRLERTAGISVENLQSIHKVLIEIVKEGKQLDTTNVYWPLPEGNVQLIMIRRKGKARFQFRPSGSHATFVSPEFELDLPKKVKIGLTASNISAKPFTANFEDFAVLSDATVIDEEFAEAEKKPPTKKDEPKKP